MVGLVLTAQDPAVSGGSEVECSCKGPLLVFSLAVTCGQQGFAPYVPLAVFWVYNSSLPSTTGHTGYIACLACIMYGSSHASLT